MPQTEDRLRASRSIAPLFVNLLLFLLLVPLFAAAAGAKTLFVKPGGTGDGSSWGSALGTVETAVTAAAASDEVWVAAGTYSTNLVMDKGIALYGGFAGTETARDQRDWRKNVTTLKAAVRPAQDGPSVVKITAAGATLDGFTITGGLARYGAGVYISGAGVTIANNIIADNIASSSDAYFSYDSLGGGIYVESGDPLIAGNTIKDNSAWPSGGGIYIASGSPIIRGNVIANNHAGSFSVRFNLHLGGGGGIVGGTPTITGNVISGNTSTDSLYQCDPAAIYCQGAVVVNNLIIHNRGSFISGGVAGATVLVNNTIVDNTLTTSAGTYSALATTIAANNIIAFNAGGLGAPTSTAPEAVHHNNVFSNGASNYYGIADQTGQNGNIAADPQFVDAVRDDYHLLPSSPSVDTGDDTVAQAGDTDLDGQPRRQGAHIDMGAFELAPNAAPDRLNLLTQPKDAAIDTPFPTAPVVQVLDAAGRQAVTYYGPVTVSLKPGAGTAGATLKGTTTVNAKDGRATFTDLSIDTPGQGYVLVFTLGTLPPVESQPVAVRGVAVRLGFVTTPHAALAGRNMKPAPAVAILDAAGNILTNATGTISISLKAGTGTPGAKLTGTTSAATVNGVATFDQFAIDTPGEGYVLVATGGDVPAESAPIAIYPTGTPLHVKPDGDDTQGGYTWDTALKTIATAMDRAGDADPIWVAAGDYTETLLINKAVRLYGGFGDEEADPAQRDLASNITTIRPATAGTSVVTIAGSAAVLDGFTITGGTAVQGGGVRIITGAPVLRNNTITGNTAKTVSVGDYGAGGGIFINDGIALIENNVIRDNITDMNGGGIAVGGGTPTIRGNIITGNQAQGYYSADPFMFYQGHGGGIAVGAAIVTRNTIVGNKADMGSGIEGTNARITENVLARNKDGYAISGSNLTILNNTIVDTGLFLFDDQSVVVNNIVAFAGNTISTAQAQVRNNDFYGYPAGDPVSGYIGKFGNINMDPMFQDRAKDDFHLLPGSPAIDLGDDTVVEAGETDRDGTPRKLHAHVDIGAYEAVTYLTGTLSGVVHAMLISGGLGMATAADFVALDVNADSRITTNDAVVLVRRSVGLQ